MNSSHETGIGFICFSRSNGGLELMLVKLARALSERGHHVLFVCRPQSPLAIAFSGSRIIVAEIEPLLSSAGIPTARVIKRLFSNHSIRIAVAGTSKDISTAALVKFFLSGLRVVFIQQMQSGISKKDVLHRWSYHALDRWFTLTQAMKRSTVENTIVQKDRIEVLPFGVDVERFTRRRYKSQAACRRAFKLPLRKKIIALIGRLDPQKGHVTLLEAAPAVLAAISNCHFLFVGEETKGEEGFRTRLQAFSKEQRLDASVQFLPFTDRVPELLAAVDVLVMPSHSETFGYLALEGMSMGLPVVGTNAGGLPEIIVDGETGLLVEPKNSESLAEALVTLLSDPRLCNRLARRGRRRVVSTFDFRDSIHRFELSLLNLLR